MALSANVFKTVTFTPISNPASMYVAPAGYTGVVLLAQLSNTSATTHQVTFSHYRSGSFTEIVKNFSIQGNDSVSLLHGRLVLESGDALYIESSTTSTDLKFICSILESLNI